MQNKKEFNYFSEVERKIQMIYFALEFVCKEKLSKIDNPEKLIT